MAFVRREAAGALDSSIIDMCDETLAAMLDNNFSLPAQPPPRVVKQSIGDRRADFIRMIGKVAASPTAARSTEEAAKILATKSAGFDGFLIGAGQKFLKLLRVPIKFT